MRALRLCLLLILTPALFGCAARRDAVQCAVHDALPGNANRFGQETAFQPAVLIEVPQTRQATPYTCGVAVVQSILAYNGFYYRQDVLEEKVGATPEDGTNPRQIMAGLREFGIGAELEQNIGLERLRARIDSGKPVICVLQAWNDDPGFDYSTGWDDGHYAIAIGYDDARIYFMDPSTLDNYTYIDNARFLERWHDGNERIQLHQAGIIVTNPSPVFKKDTFEPML